MEGGGNVEFSLFHHGRRLFINRLSASVAFPRVWEKVDDACCAQVHLKPPAAFRREGGGGQSLFPASRRRLNSGALSSIPVVLQTVAFVCEVTRARRDAARFPAALGCYNQSAVFKKRPASLARRPKNAPSCCEFNLRVREGQRASSPDGPAVCSVSNCGSSLCPASRSSCPSE